MLIWLWLTATIAHSQVLGYSFFNPHSPQIEWQIKETPNFEIVFDKKQEGLAQKVALEAQRAHSLLVPLLKVQPSQKTVIIISDATDSPNGSATGFPRPTIEIFPVLPNVYDSIGEYGDWIREVVTHEYSHILNFEPYSGPVGFLRTIFGSIWKPPVFLPRWYMEGFAVEMETRFSSGGRGRSLLYEAQARAFFEDGKWGTESIDRIGATNIPTWPRGSRPYYFGWLLMHELSAQKGLGIYETLNTRYGGRAPWFINGPMEDLFDVDYDEFLQKTYLSTQERISQQINEIKKSGIKNGQFLQQTGYFNFSPQISPDGLKLAAVVSNYNEDPSIAVWQRPNLKTSFTQALHFTTIVSGKEISQVSWSNDSKTLIYDRQDSWRHHSNFNDLYQINMDDKNEQRLTYGLRAREGTQVGQNNIIFVKLDGANSTLCELDKITKQVKTLFIPAAGHRISNPRAFKDGVIYSHRDNSGKEWIEFFNLKDQKISQLTNSVEDQTPSPKNENSFLFSKKGQIFEGNSKFSRLLAANTTEALGPIWDKETEEIIYSRMTSNGYQLESKKPDYTKNYPSLKPLWNYDASPTGKLTTDKFKNSNYNGLSYLFPQYWLPFVYFVPGGTLFDVSTSANDPLYFHQYMIDVGYDTRAQQPKESFQYTNSTLPFLIDAYFANDYQYLAGASTTEHFLYGSIQTSHFLQKDKTEWMLQPYFNYRQTDYPGFYFTEIGPGISISHNTLGTKKDYQISPESGHVISVGYKYFLPNLGNTSYPAVDAKATFYLSGKPLPQRNVIKLQASFWLSPAQDTILTGTQQAGGDYGSPFYTQSFMVRGYPYGEFIGNNLYNLNFEYRFPLAYPFSGPGTFPAFLDAWHMAVVADALTLDGGYYDTDTYFLKAAKAGKKIFGSAGVELKADFHFFYFVPLTFKLGYYQAFTKEAFGGTSILLGVGSTL